VPRDDGYDAPARHGRRAETRRSVPLWPTPDRDRELPSATELGAWGLFCSVLAAGLTAATGEGGGPAASLGGLGLAATAALWAAARRGEDATGPAGPRSSGQPPTGA
jgi:hypothetical protein